MPEKKAEAIKWLTDKIRSLRMAPSINGCGPENWAEQLEIMEACLEAVNKYDQNATEMRPSCKPLTLEQLREMDGMPVWVTPAGFFALVIAKRGKRVELICNDGERVYADKEIELVGPVYACPPAHIGREAWVSVEERLPDNEKPVLAYYGFYREDDDLGARFIGTLTYFCYDPEPHWKHESTGLFVTHWMPLPEPPEKEE